MVVDLERVGNIPIENNSPIKTPRALEEGKNYPWPMYITAGDISRNGTKIILRSYNGKYVFEKNMCHKIT